MKRKTSEWKWKVPKYNWKRQNETEGAKTEPKAPEWNPRGLSGVGGHILNSSKLKSVTFLRK